MAAARMKNRPENGGEPQFEEERKKSMKIGISTQSNAGTTAFLKGDDGKHELGASLGVGNDRFPDRAVLSKRIFGGPTNPIESLSGDGFREGNAEIGATLDLGRPRNSFDTAIPIAGIYVTGSIPVTGNITAHFHLNLSTELLSKQVIDSPSVAAGKEGFASLGFEHGGVEAGMYGDKRGMRGYVGVSPSDKVGLRLTYPMSHDFTEQRAGLGFSVTYNIGGK